MSRILRHRRLVIAGATAAALLVSAAAVALLSSTRSSGSSSSGSSIAALPPGGAVQGKSPTLGDTSSNGVAYGQPGVEGAGVAAATPTPSSQIASDVSPLDAQRFLVRTGEMSLTVGKGGVPQAAARVVGLTTGYGGYVLTSQVSTTDSSSPPFADITVRVPASMYDVAIQRFGALGRVQAVKTNADDVTGQYVDLRARLAQARRIDQRLLGFLARARTVTEALAVQTRIDATELKVEQLTGQLKALREQVTYGTLAVSITERTAHHAATHRGGFLGALSASWRHLVAGFEAIVVGLGAVIPYAVLLAALAGAAWFGARAAVRLRQRVRLEQ
jgi:hypothetical protein